MWPFSRRTQPKPIQAKFDLAQTTSENRKHWANADGLSARAAISPAVRRVVRLRSRYESENNSWYAGILRTAVNHIVGNGPRLQMLTLNLEANERLEKAFSRWAKKIDLADMLRTICEAYWRDGEVFVMRADRPQNYPLTLTCERLNQIRLLRRGSGPSITMRLSMTESGSIAPRTSWKSTSMTAIRAATRR